MTKAFLLMGSPRGRKSSSNTICVYLQELFEKKGFECQEPIVLRSIVSADEKMNEMLATIEEADIIVLVAPLYDDTSPAIVVKTIYILRAVRPIAECLFFQYIRCK